MTKLIINLLTTGTIDYDDSYSPESETRVGIEMEWFNDEWNWSMPEGLTGDQRSVVQSLVEKWIDTHQDATNDDMYHAQKEDAA